MDRKTFTIGILIAVIGLLCLTGYYHYNHTESVRDTTKVCVTVYDTIADIMPVYKDSTVVKYVTKVLPVEKDIADRDTAAAMSGESDSAAVVLPITQKTYTDDSTYTAYVSGYEPSLDSIFVYNKTITETLTITETITKTKEYPFGVGITAGAGYGIIHRKPDVFVGLSVYYRLWPRKVKK